MSLRVLIVPDKFKGTLTAGQAAQAIARGWRKGRPRDRLDLLPLTDGGDGFGKIIGDLRSANKRSAATADAAHRRCVTPWWCIGGHTAIVESALAIGLGMLPPGSFHPFQLDTYGLGLLLRTIAGRGVRECVVGIGGSATNDGGFGMARALGWEFLDNSGEAIEQWTELPRLVSIQPPERGRWFRKVVVAIDVRNPLLGPRGATRVYGPQKGIRPSQFRRAEKCLTQLARVVRNELGRDYAHQPGAGAAGGLGFGLSAFASAELAGGFDLFARYSKLRRRIAGADLVITGEGSVDRSTFMGKGVGQVAQLCRAAQVPCIALAGRVTPQARRRDLFARAVGLTDLTSASEAMADASACLERLAREVASH